MIAFRFNTSYVNVYRRMYWLLLLQKKVSIHPMLMFIAVVSPVTIAVLPFQYILC